MMRMIGAILFVLTAQQCLAQPPGVPPATGQPSHGHGHHGKPLEFASEVHNRDHILEHLQSVIATKSKEEMTEEELEFHYFKLHDYDNNNKLDGVEIGKALTHFHDDDPKAAFFFSDDEFMDIIDDVLRTDDITGDGYVDYAEFMAAQNSASTKGKPLHHKNEMDDLLENPHPPSSVPVDNIKPPGTLTEMEIDLPKSMEDDANIEDDVILRSGHPRQRHQQLQSHEEYERQGDNQQRQEKDENLHRVLEEHRQLQDQYLQMQIQKDNQDQNQGHQKDSTEEQQIHHLHQQQQYHSQASSQEQH